MNRDWIQIDPVRTCAHFCVGGLKWILSRFRQSTSGRWIGSGSEVDLHRKSICHVTICVIKLEFIANTRFDFQIILSTQMYRNVEWSLERGYDQCIVGGMNTCIHTVRTFATCLLLRASSVFLYCFSPEQAFARSLADFVCFSPKNLKTKTSIQTNISKDLLDLKI